MNLLLDTHVVLWWLDDSPMLSEKTKTLIADPQNIVFISVAVIWEISIKQALGKLEIPDDFRRVLERQHFDFLDITPDHAYAVAALPPHHRDPFDRMLIAQAKVEGMHLLSHDRRMLLYDISVIEA